MSDKNKKEGNQGLYDLILNMDIEDKDIDALCISYLLQLVSLLKNLNAINDDLKNGLKGVPRQKLLGEKKVCIDYINNTRNVIDNIILTAVIAKFDKTYSANLFENNGEEVEVNKTEIIKKINKISLSAMDKIKSKIDTNKEDERMTDNSKDGKASNLAERKKDE